MGELRDSGVLVHTATPLRQVEEDAGAETWIEGERGEMGPEPVRDDAGAFAAVLFLPLGTEEPGPRSRKITRPTLLFEPLDNAGAPVRVSPDDELMVLAPELAVVVGAEEARWQVEGAPQAFGEPGLQPVGVQAVLKRVTD